MKNANHVWTIVLAAGEGSRLKTISVDESGRPVPKQFWRVAGGTTMLHWTLNRADRWSGRFRTVPVVAADHVAWWEKDLADLPAWNILVQPHNRGTAAGILMPVLDIVARDREATVIVLPSDHYVENEEALDLGIERAVAALDEEPDRVILLGITPDEADPELGYIVPERGGARTSAEFAAGSGDADAWHKVATASSGRPVSAVEPRAEAHPVAAFVEKPPARTAEALVTRGALWNSFIFVARGTALLQLFAATERRLVERFVEAIEGSGFLPAEMERIYREIPTRDFSRDVCQKRPDLLRVVAVPPCGWTDLGTPPRVRSWQEARDRRAPAITAENLYYGRTSIST